MTNWPHYGGWRGCYTTCLNTEKGEGVTILVSLQRNEMELQSWQNYRGGEGVTILASLHKEDRELQYRPLNKERKGSAKLASL